MCPLSSFNAFLCSAQAAHRWQRGPSPSVAEGSQHSAATHASSGPIAPFPWGCLVAQSSPGVSAVAAWGSGTTVCCRQLCLDKDRRCAWHPAGGLGVQASFGATGTVSWLWVTPAKAGLGAPPARSRHTGQRVGNGTSAAQHCPARPCSLQWGRPRPAAGPRHPPASSSACRFWVPTFNFSPQSTARSRATLRGSPHGSLQSDQPERAEGGCSYTLM